MENAAGIASMMLTTECLIADKKEDEKMPAMPPEEWAAWAAECIEPIRQQYLRRISGNKTTRSSVNTKQTKKPPRKRGLFDDNSCLPCINNGIMLINEELNMDVNNASE